jgi:hypothetical protein
VDRLRRLAQPSGLRGAPETASLPNYTPHPINHPLARSVQVAHHKGEIYLAGVGGIFVGSVGNMCATTTDETVHVAWSKLPLDLPPVRDCAHLVRSARCAGDTAAQGVEQYRLPREKKHLDRVRRCCVAIAIFLRTIAAAASATLPALSVDAMVLAGDRSRGGAGAIQPHRRGRPPAVEGLKRRSDPFPPLRCLTPSASRCTQKTCTLQ